MVRQALKNRRSLTCLEGAISRTAFMLAWPGGKGGVGALAIGQATECFGDRDLCPELSFARHCTAHATRAFRRAIRRWQAGRIASPHRLPWCGLRADPASLRRSTAGSRSGFGPHATAPRALGATCSGRWRRLSHQRIVSRFATAAVAGTRIAPEGSCRPRRPHANAGRAIRSSSICLISTRCCLPSPSNLT